MRRLDWEPSGQDGDAGRHMPANALSATASSASIGNSQGRASAPATTMRMHIGERSEIRRIGFYERAGPGGLLRTLGVRGAPPKAGLRWFSTGQRAPKSLPRASRVAAGHGV